MILGKSPGRQASQLPLSAADFGVPVQDCGLDGSLALLLLGCYWINP